VAKFVCTKKRTDTAGCAYQTPPAIPADHSATTPDVFTLSHNAPCSRNSNSPSELRAGSFYRPEMV